MPVSIYKSLIVRTRAPSITLILIGVSIWLLLQVRGNGGLSEYRYKAGSNRLKAIDDQRVRYDRSGNTISRQKNERLHYNTAGRLARYQRGGRVTTYTYNAYGQRTMKRTRSQAGAAAGGRDTVLYHYDRQGRLIMESDATGRPLVDYVWMDNRPVLQTVYDGNPTAEVTRTYLLTDHSGTPRVGLNDQQQIVWRWDDGGFGEEKADEDPDGDGHKVRINLRFPGQYYDKESGLHYNHFRYYDPRMGRYMTSDRLGILFDFSDPSRQLTAQMGVSIPHFTSFNGLNHTYGYANQNPLMYTDPTGEFTPIGGAIGGAAAGAVGSFFGTLAAGGGFKNAFFARIDGAAIGGSAGFIAGFGPAGMVVGIGFDLIANGFVGASIANAAGRQTTSGGCND